MTKRNEYLIKCRVKSVNSNKICFSKVLELWMDSNAVRLKGATKNKYQSIIETHIVPTLGKQYVDCISSAQINIFLDEKLKNGRIDGEGGLSPSYVRSMMLIINSALTFAANENMCAPLKTPINKPQLNKSKITLLSRYNREKLEQQTFNNNSLTELGIYISLHTGLRIGEVCALRWEDIDFENKVLYVRHTIARIRANDAEKVKSKLVMDKPKTKSSDRAIPIDSKLYSVLSKMKAYSKSPFVISDKKDFISPRTFEYRFKKVLERNCIPPVNYHALRHTFATRCIEVGVDIKTLSEILGHASVGITLNTYVHSSMEMKRMQIEKLIH